MKNTIPLAFKTTFHVALAVSSFTTLTNFKQSFFGRKIFHLPKAAGTMFIPNKSKLEIIESVNFKKKSEN